MTIINDIDQSLDVVTKRRLAEERGHETACYIIENKDRLESIPEDTPQTSTSQVLAWNSPTATRIPSTIKKS
jgi:hypothetical protein